LRQSYYERHGHFPRTLKAAFGPYAALDVPQIKRLTERQMIAGILIALALSVLLIWGVK
jgi:hypothetical protein